MLLQNLPNEVLEHILNYIDLESLLALYKTCKKFRQIVSYHKYWSTRARTCFAANQQSEYSIQKSAYVCSPFEKCRLEDNWAKANFAQFLLLTMPNSYMPWLQLDEERLWVGFGKSIKSYKKSDIVSLLVIGKRYKLQQHEHVFGDPTAKGDISRFYKSKNLIMYNQVNKLCCYDTYSNKYIFQRDLSEIPNSGDTEVETNMQDWKTNDALDLHTDNNIAVFQTNGSVFLAPLSDLAKIELGTMKTWNRNCWRLKLSDSGQRLVGASKDGNSYLYDVERMTELAVLKGANKTSTVTDICWLNPHLFLTGGYDTILRLWDTRYLSQNATKAAIELEDPFNTGIYSIASDKYNSVLTGMQMDGRINAIDIRNAKYVQLYYMSTKVPSPVYSLDFDSRRLVSVTASTLHVLDFSIYGPRVLLVNYWGHIVGYRNDHRMWLA